ncbi:MAG: restriction endonuclease subunit S [Selenomonadaceae bacterium]|nr:restriction endonuclease subunit S [Selenomonadaceae bacterium]
MESDNELLCSSYLFYALRDTKLKSRIEARQSGTTVSGIRASELKKVEINLPPLETQKKIAAVLSVLDDKIELNNAINKNLEEQAQAIFKSWFIDFEPFGSTMPDDWRKGRVEEIIIFHDSKRIPLSANKRNEMEKVYPYYGATSIMDYVESYIFDGIFLLFAEDGTVIDDKGFPILQYVEGKFWVNNHAHVLTGRLGFSVETLYLLFKTTKITSIVTGAVQQKISQSNLKQVPVIVPSYEDLIKFDKIIYPMFEMIRSLRTENKKLGELRDALLPRLMSGEIDVSAVTI